MNRSDLLQRARTVIAGELVCPTWKITESADFRDDLKADSLDIVSLTSALEEEFDVAISDDEASFCQTVGTALDIIEAKLDGGAGRPRFRTAVRL